MTKTLTLVKKERLLVEPTEWDMEDPEVLQTLNDKDVFGVFQFETKTALSMIEEIGIDAFSDMYAATSLGRPDPLSAELHKAYGRRKRGEELWTHLKCMGDIDLRSFGLPIFQEHPMKFSRQIAGFSAQEANKFRKGLAKGKDNEQAMQTLQKMLGELKERSKPSIEKGLITEDQLEEMLDMLKDVGGYGFNACLSGHTLVELKDVTRKKILDIKPGEEIKCYDPKTGQLCLYPVKRVIDNGIKTVYDVSISSGHSITCTMDHKFMCVDGKMRPLKEVIKEAHMIVTKNGGCMVYTHGNKREMQTYDLEIDSKDHNFFANNICVSNSHATAYAMIAYWCMYLKYYYPAHFLCALFNHTEISDKDKGGTPYIYKYVRYARKKGILVSPPDINDSKTDFSILDSNTIMWSLKDIKMIKNSAQLIVESQRYDKFEDVLERIPKRQLNKTKMVNLIKVGAFDKFGLSREYLLNHYLGEIRKEKGFDGVKYDAEDQAEAETELLGICLSQKVLPNLDPKELESYGIKRLEYLPRVRGGMTGLFIGRVQRVVKRKAKKSGKDMLIVSLYDDTDDVDFFVWESHIGRVEDSLEVGKIVTVPLEKFRDGGGCFFNGDCDQLVVLE